MRRTIGTVVSDVPERDATTATSALKREQCAARLHQLALRLRIAFEHFILERVPDVPVQFVKGLVELDLGDIARARQTRPSSRR